MTMGPATIGCSVKEIYTMDTFLAYHNTCQQQRLHDKVMDNKTLQIIMIYSRLKQCRLQSTRDARRNCATMLQAYGTRPYILTCLSIIHVSLYNEIHVQV